MNPPREFRSGPGWAIGLLGLLVSTAWLLSGCNNSSRGGSAVGSNAAVKPVNPPEIIVKLKEGKALTTQEMGGKTIFLYGGQPLTIFDNLPEAGDLRIRQSFPKFSARWQRDREWRTGGFDSVDVQRIIQLADVCGPREVGGGPGGNIRGLIEQWQGDRQAWTDHQDGAEAVLRLLSGSQPQAQPQPSSPARRAPSLTRAPRRSGRVSNDDRQKAQAFVNAVRADSLVFGGAREPLAIPTLLDLLKCPSITREDSQSVYRFARRLRKESGDAGVGDVAVKAIDQLILGQTVGSRDALAVTSWMRLLAGKDALDQEKARPSVDLFLRVGIASRAVNVDQLLTSLRGHTDVVETAVRAFPRGPATSEPTVSGTPPAAQSYQDPDTVGIDAEAAWSVPGGGGDYVRLIVCDASFREVWNSALNVATDAVHSDLPVLNPVLKTLVPGKINMLREPWGDSQNDRIHGTETLGILLAKKDGDDCDGSPYVCPATDDSYAAKIAVTGMCRGVPEVYFSSVLPNEADLEAHSDGVTSALDEIADALPTFPTGGDVLLIESQLATDDVATCSSGDCPSMLPIEANYDNFALIRGLADDGVTVIEPAGNGWGELSEVSSTSVQWNPADDSGAIMVGAGMPYCNVTPRARMTESNYGDRVDCQGWGLCVQSTTFNPYTNEEAFGEYTHTSAATAIMGGLVTCLQSAHYGRFTMFLTPEVLRGYLREDENGSPQAVEPGRIGPLPSLRKLLIRLEILPPVA